MGGLCRCPTQQPQHLHRATDVPPTHVRFRPQSLRAHFYAATALPQRAQACLMPTPFWPILRPVEEIAEARLGEREHEDGAARRLGHVRAAAVQRAVVEHERRPRAQRRRARRAERLLALRKYARGGGRAAGRGGGRGARARSGPSRGEEEGRRDADGGGGGGCGAISAPLPRVGDEPQRRHGDGTMKTRDARAHTTTTLREPWRAA